MLKKMLLKFCDQQGDFEQRFCTALANKEADIVIREAHTIKGVSGTLGLSTIQHAALELEMACRENQDDIKDLLQKLLDELNKVQDALKVLN